MFAGISKSALAILILLVGMNAAVLAHEHHPSQKPHVERHTHHDSQRHEQHWRDQRHHHKAQQHHWRYDQTDRYSRR